MQLASRGAPQRLADAAGGVGHDLRQDVGVAGDHADLRVTEDLHHDLLINALGASVTGRKGGGRGTAGGVVPTIPVLEGISAALDADLIVELAHERYVPRPRRLPCAG